MHPDRSGISHLQIAVVSLQQRFKNPVRYANPVLTARSGSGRSPADCSAWELFAGPSTGQPQDVPFNTLRSSTSCNEHGVFGNNNSMIDHQKSVDWWWRWDMAS
jgi:hypothetical protein